MDAAVCEEEHGRNLPRGVQPQKVMAHAGAAEHERGTMFAAGSAGRPVALLTVQLNQFSSGVGGQSSAAFVAEQFAADMYHLRKPGQPVAECGVGAWGPERVFDGRGRGVQSNTRHLQVRILRLAVEAHGPQPRQPDSGRTVTPRGLKAPLDLVAVPCIRVAQVEPIAPAPAEEGVFVGEGPARGLKQRRGACAGVEFE